MDWTLWIIVLLAVAIAGWYGANAWLNRPPPPAQLSCRTCRKLKRQLQWWRLWFGVATASLLVAFAFDFRSI